MPGLAVCADKGMLLFALRSFLRIVIAELGAFGLRASLVLLDHCTWQGLRRGSADHRKEYGATESQSEASRNVLVDGSVHGGSGAPPTGQTGISRLAFDRTSVMFRLCVAWRGSAGSSTPL